MSKYPPPPNQQHSYSAPTTPATDDSFPGDDQSWNIQSTSQPQTPEEFQAFQQAQDPQNYQLHAQDPQQYQQHPHEPHHPAVIQLETSPHIVPSQREISPAGHDLAPVRLHPVDTLSPEGSYALQPPEVSSHPASARAPMRPASLEIPVRPTGTSSAGADMSPVQDNAVRYAARSVPAAGPSTSVLRQSTMKQSHRATPYARATHGAIAEPASTPGSSKSALSRSQQKQRRVDVTETQPRQFRFRHEYSSAKPTEPSALRQSTSMSPPSTAQSPMAYSPPAILSPPSPQGPPLQSFETLPVSTIPSGRGFSVPSTVQQPQSAPQNAPAVPRMIITSDMHYDPESQMLTAMLEIPGVRRQDISVTLSTSIYNCVRQVRIHGRSYPVFPPVFANSQGVPSQSINGTGWTICRERRYGEFSRIFPVHPLMTVNDIDASVHDGILTLRMRCGTPASSTDEAIVPIRGS